MKKFIIASLLSVSFLTACNSEKKEATTDSAKADTSAAVPVDKTTMDKAWAAYMTPGPTHQMMAKDNGKWNAEISFYYNPDSPSVHKTVCENKMILGGRYQQSTYKGDIDGMQFEGIGTLAYDNSRKTYISTWVDNMGTGIIYLEGTYDEASKTLTLQGKTVDVTTGKDMMTKETLKIIDDNTKQMEMFDVKDGKETKSMSIKLTRAK
jgi:hypothetical protein